MASTESGHIVMRMSASDVQALLQTNRRPDPVAFEPGQLIFLQGSPSDGVFFLQSGRVKLSVLSQSGREAVIAVIGPGEFFGEGALAGHTVRTGSAAAIVRSLLLQIDTAVMIQVLRTDHGMADRFLAHLLTRNTRLEEDLVDRLFNSSEKRLARALLQLANNGRPDRVERIVPRMSQETLAQIVGTTRPRVNQFLKKFKRLGLIGYDREGPITVERSLMSVLRQD